jgi:dTDP-4-amino-4,6-dideoxygalactose transaminase
MYERYHHDVVGVNSRLDSFQAAVLRAKLPRLDIYNEARKEAAFKYDQAFEGQEHIVTPYRDAKCDTHVFHQYTLKITNGKRDALVKHLTDKNIPCAVYYPIPLHNQKAYEDPRYSDADFPVTNQLVKEVISLPMHTELTDDQIEHISKTIIEFVNN